MIIGVRAFNSDKSLYDIKSQITDYMNGGGNVIVQYNTSRNIDVNKFAPYPFKLSRNRDKVLDQKEVDDGTWAIP